LTVSGILGDPLRGQAADVTVSASYPYNVSLLGLVVASGQLNSTMKERVE